MRILGITIPENKHIEIGLTALYGVGRARAHKILESAGVEPRALPKNLTTEAEAAIRKAAESYTIEGDLRRDIAANIRRLKDIKTYRGTRHVRGLPVRGQRTKTNSRTRRGNVRKTMGTGRKTAEKK